MNKKGNVKLLGAVVLLVIIAVTGATIFDASESEQEQLYPCLRVANASIVEIVKSPWGMKCDKGINQEALVINGIPVSGVAATLHGGTTIRYSIPQREYSLSFKAAIPDYIAGRGGATVRLLVKSGSKVLATSEVVKHGSSVSLSVDISGVQEFSIAVDDGGDGFFCDHVVVTDIALMPK